MKLGNALTLTLVIILAAPNVVPASNFIKEVFNKTSTSVPSESVVIHTNNDTTLKFTQEELDALISKEFTLLEQSKSEAEQLEKIQNLTEFVHKGNEQLLQSAVLVFGEYTTTIVKTVVFDEKNTKVVSNDFHIAYGVDLSKGTYTFDEETMAITLELPKSAVKLEHCMAADNFQELNAQHGFFTSSKKKTQFVYDASNELNRAAVAQTQKSFEELKEAATIAVESFMFNDIKQLNLIGLTDIEFKLNWTDM